MKRHLTRVFRHPIKKRTMNRTANFTKAIMRGTKKRSNQDQHDKKKGSKQAALNWTSVKKTALLKTVLKAKSNKCNTTTKHNGARSEN